MKDIKEIYDMIDVNDLKILHQLDSWVGRSRNYILLEEDVMEEDTFILRKYVDTRGVTELKDMYVYSWDLDTNSLSCCRIGYNIVNKTESTDTICDDTILSWRRGRPVLINYNSIIDAETFIMLDHVKDDKESMTVKEFIGILENMRYTDKLTFWNDDKNVLTVSKVDKLWIFVSGVVAFTGDKIEEVGVCVKVSYLGKPIATIIVPKSMRWEIT